MRVRSTIPGKIIPESLIPEIHISHFTNVDASDPANQPHRDEDYIFLFQKKGILRLMVDNELVEMTGRSVYFILPGQLHHHVSSDTESWIIAVGSYFLQKPLRSKLNEQYYLKKAAPVSKKKAERFMQLIKFLAEELDNPLYQFSEMIVRKGLIDVISAMTAEEYATASSLQQGEHNRFAAITHEFKELLLNNFKKMKKPAEYADILNVSAPYLNQVIKASTGSTVSYWIQKMIMNEAKVLLSSTSKPVKDIAYELGYTDQAYFSRIFSRSQKLSPLAFRLMLRQN